MADAMHALMCRVFVPHRNLKKTVRLEPEETVWALKLSLIDKMALDNDKEEDPYNFGIYLPKAGVYLDEMRQISSYFFSDQVYFEFKRKAREQKLPEKQVQKINTDKHQRQFYEYQTTRQYAKMRGMLDKGFDPNFNYKFNGETPMTLAATSDDVEGIVLFYSGGGAFLDYRSTDGKTPLHKAATKGRFNALKTLLKHGASANVRDKTNLTPLYDACMHGKTKCAESLLQANSPINVIDSNGRTELHQACANNFPEVVELLVTYGADMDAANEPGNTPLHICASKGTTECAGVLLSKGAPKDKTNLAGNTAFQVAIMFNNHELAEVINSFKKEDIVPVVLMNAPKIVYDDDPVVENYYIPPMPPAGTVGIYAAPPDAPARRKVYHSLPPPPPPADMINYSSISSVISVGHPAGGDDSDSVRSDGVSVLTTSSDAFSFPPPPPMDLPPPPPQQLLDTLRR